MKKNVIGIIYPIGIEFNGNTIKERSLGGSETWCVKISQALTEIGYRVMVFNHTSYWMFDDYGVEWIPLNFLENRLEIINFEAIIVSRFYEGIINTIKSSNCTNKVFLQSHDIVLGYDAFSRNPIATIYNDDELGNDIINQYCPLTDFHASLLTRYHQIPKDRTTCIPNGIDIELIRSIPEQERINRILWTSRPERGLETLVNEIVPRVQQEIPDFGVDVAMYGYIPEWVQNNEGVNFLGSLTKDKLYQEMKRRKVWWYPASFMETFNCTAVENALCGVELVLPYVHAMNDVFKYFNHLGTKSCIVDNDFNEYDPIEFYNESAQMIIDAIKNYDNPDKVALREAKIKYFEDNYSWKKVAEQWKKLIEKY